MQSDFFPVLEYWWKLSYNAAPFILVFTYENDIHLPHCSWGTSSE